MIGTKENLHFQPILLGSDATVYGMARAFHEEYGIKSIALAGRQLIHTRFSKIVDVNIIKGFADYDVFLPEILKFARKYRQSHPNQVLLLIPLGDVYANHVARGQKKLREYFRFNTIDFELCQNLALKNYFYQTCEKYALPYPKTWYFTAADVQAGRHRELDLPTPLAMKPASSTKWLKVDYPGRKKAYVFDRLEEFYQQLELSYQHGYDDQMIVQDFIPGGDECMRVVNMYVDQHSRVRMMAVGEILVEDKSPRLVGNYNALRTGEPLPVLKSIAAFLQAIHYHGVANFDLKYDCRDNQYKLFEINLRNGASSYFVTLNGQNLAKYYVEDLVYDRDPQSADPIICRGDYLSTVLSKPELMHAVSGSKHEDFVRRAFETGKYANPLRYPADLGLRRRIALQRLTKMHTQNYRKYSQGSVSMPVKSDQ